MRGTARAACRINQPLQIGLVVRFGEETRLPVVPTLHDVQGYAVKVNAGAAGHGRVSLNPVSFPHMFQA